MVSVIISTYKRDPEIVERALKSVINQTYYDLEIIVVDDSPSSYEKRGLVEAMICSYRDLANINYIKHENNMGACVARNTGINVSKGKYICFLDDDDELCNNKIELQVAALEANPNAAMVYCNCIVYDELSGERKVQEKKMHRGYIYEKLLENNFVGTSSFPLIKADVLKAIGGFDPLLPACQDYDVWLRISQCYLIDYIDEALVVYHCHPGEQITKNPKKRITGLKRVIEKNMPALQRNRKLWSLNFLKLIPDYIQDNRVKEAAVVVGKCIVHCPFLLQNYRYLIVVLRKVFFESNI